MADQGVQVLVEIGHRAWYRKKATPEKTHDWILYVRGSDGNDISHFVEKIVFNLHQSFNPPRRVLKSPPYELRESGYGEFMPIIDIYFKNKGEKGAQRKVTIQYYLNLNREDSPPIDNIRPEKLKFFSPAEEFLEKVLRAGGVILGSDGCPIPQSKPIPRPSVVDLQPQNISSSQSFHDSRNHDASDFLVDVDSAAKSASQLAKKRKRSTEANPMSNDSNSSNESNASRRSSSKSDPLEKDSDNRSGGVTKQKMHVALFELTDDDSLKKKKKPATEKSEQSSKSRSVEQKSAKVETTEDNAKQHRSGKDERHKHSSGKSHHRRDADGGSGRRDHHGEKDGGGGGGGGGGGHSKPKSEDRNSRSSSRTPSKVKSLESTSGTSRVHGSSSSHGLSSTHHRSSSSSSSRHHSNSKSSKVDGGSSRHSGGQSQKGDSSSSNHHRASSSSSKHRLSSTEQNNLQRKTSADIQIRLSPIDIHDRSASSSSTRKLETPSSGNRVGPSPDGFSGGKPNDLSPMKKGRRNPAAAASSPAGYLPPTFDLSNGSDPFSASTNRSIRPKYDKLLDDMKSDDEEEDGEIRSPVATEPPELPWKLASSDRKDEKSKETSTSFDPNKKSRTSSSSATSRLEKPERFPFGTTEKPSPTKAKNDWSSSVSSEKTSPDDSSFSGSQVKAKKSHAKENVADGESRSSKKSSVSKSGGSQKDFSAVSQRTSSTKQKALLPPTDFSSFAVKSESDEKSDGQKFNFKVEPQWDNSYEALSKAEEEIVAMKKETTTELFVKSESSFYDEKKCVKSESLKKGATTTTIYSDRAANGELLISLVELKEKIDRVTSAILLNRIVDVIESAGKLKSDDDALEFDFCQLDSETMVRVKQILETESC